MGPILNINIGVLGHVDSGKTALCRALSTVGSTAAFDKHPESQQRGITLDLGFSALQLDATAASLRIPAPVGPLVAERIFGGAPDAGADSPMLQFTLVDCPGHASLIRTVIGGAQIIDAMLLVIDVTKGIQTQTAECLVLGELLGRRLIVVLNKTDMVLPGAAEDDRRAALEKSKKKLRQIFARTRWPDAPFVEVSARPGGGDDPVAAPPAEGLPPLLGQLGDVALRVAGSIAPGSTAGPSGRPERPGAAGPFVFSVDHCFPLKGQGTVLTGTVLSGAVNVGDDVHLPDHGLTRKVKGLQVFRRPVQRAACGDRVGMCVAHLDSTIMERGIVCSVPGVALAPGALPVSGAAGSGRSAVQPITCAVAEVARVRFFKETIKAGAQFHFTLGHHTVMGAMRFFRRPVGYASAACGFDLGADYEVVEELPEEAASGFGPATEGHAAGDPLPAADASTCGDGRFYAVVLLKQAVLAYAGATLIASRLDTEAHSPSCRLAVQGRLVTQDITHAALDSAFGADAAVVKKQKGAAKETETEAWRRLRVMRRKEKVAPVDRIVDDGVALITKSLAAGVQKIEKGGRGSSAPPVDVLKFVGAPVVIRPAGNDDPAARIGHGIVESPFGKSGKAKVAVRGPPVPAALKAADLEIVVSYRKYPFATAHRFTTDDV